MVTFDFVSGENFRSSLTSDYQELELAKTVGAWKAVHVLAGSIIEAILTDYLIYSGYQKRFKSDPLTMNLNEIINACRKENIISEKAANLSHVIRSYRNLIHPGRSIREGEVADENGSIIAEVLVKIIVEEISNSKKANYGNTAEQIITKLKKDSSATAILEDLLKNTNSSEIERLLLKIIPEQYFEIEKTQENAQIIDSLEKCFRLAFESANDEIKKKVMKNFIKLLKEEGKIKITFYEMAFLKAKDLAYLDEGDRVIAKKHLISILGEDKDEMVLNVMEGIGHFLTAEEAVKFTDAFIQTVSIGSSKPNADTDMRKYFDTECTLMEEDVQDKVLLRINEWVQLFSEHKNFSSLGMLQGFKDDLESRINLSDIGFDPLGDLDDHPF